MYLSFTSYGLILGIAIVFGVSLVERQIIKSEKTTRQTFLSEIFYKVGTITFIFGVLGARIWHVFTDFKLYKNDLVSSLYIWNGGLSIIGAAIGGLIGILISVLILKEIRDKKREHKKELLLQLLDFSVFGLPVGQALGRWGNYVNQELYGLPTSGFFKIFIDLENRLPGFENRAYYHPLFLYEMIATGLFAVVVHTVYNKKNIVQKLPKLGSGKLFLVYIFYYSVVRFFLDFVRIDRGVLYFGELGTNQLVLLSTILLISLYFLLQFFRIITPYVAKK